MKKSLKCALTVFLVAVIVAGAVACGVIYGNDLKAEAATTYTDGYYSYTVTDGEATITDCNTSISGDVTIPSTLGGYPVTGIGEYAFYYCTSLSSATIPEGVKSIALGSFPALKSMYFEGNMGQWCSLKIKVTNLSGYLGMYGYYPVSRGFAENLYIDGKLVEGEIEIPFGITSIPDGAFLYCEAVTKVIIPKSVTEIGDYAFYECTGLTTVDISDSVTGIGVSAFSGCTNINELTMPAGAEIYGDYGAFEGCTNIERITITKGTGVITTDYTYGSYKIDNYQNTPWYKSRESIKELVIEEGVTRIGDRAFYDCVGLTDIVIPESVTSIGQKAFQGCKGLESVTIPDNVESLEDYAFYSCSSLKQVNIGVNLKTIGNFAFTGSFVSVNENNPYFSSDESGALFNKDKTVLFKFPVYSTLTEYSIPESVIEISSNAFQNNKTISKITIPENVKTIGASAFRNCSAIKTVNYNAIDCIVTKTPVYDDWTGEITDYASAFPASITKVNIGSKVTVIPEYAFYGCGALIEVDFKNADNLAEIGDYAFGFCKSLTMIELPPTICDIGYGAFYNCDSLINVHIPETSINSIDYAVFNNSFSVLCSEVSNGTVYNYAKDNKLAFRKCNGTHTGDEDLGGKYEVIASGKCGKNLEWKVYGDCRLVITGSGAMYDTWKWPSDVPWKAYRLAIKEVEISEEATSIGNYAFSSFKRLETITIPENITLVGKQAFYNCKELKKVNFNAVNCERMSTYKDGYTYPTIDVEIYYENITTAFDGCSKLETIIFGDKVTVIPFYGFYNCDAITDIELPESVLSIEAGAFRDCGSLAKVELSDKVVSIKAGAFRDCVSLTEIGLSDSLTEIGELAFYNCYSLEQINIPEGVKVIEGRTFYACAELQYVSLPDSLVEIKDRAFYYCRSLLGITIPANVKKIDWRAFNHCKKLTCIYFNAENCEEMYFFTYGGETGDTEVWGSAFSNCENLSYIIIGDNVKTLPQTSQGASEFIHMPTGLTSIDDGWYLTKYICATSENCNARTYADKNGIEFRVCEGNHENHFHIPDEWTITKEATEAENGEKTAKCTICTETMTESIPKLDIKDVTDVTTGVSVQFNANCFAGKVGLTASKSEDEEIIILIEERTGYEEMQLYNVSLTVDGVVTQPEEEVTLKIPVPEEYDHENTVVYSVNPETGAIKEIDSEIENGFIVFETADVGYFAVVEKTSSGDGGDTGNEGGETPVPDVGGAASISLRKPTTATVNYGDTLILHANVSTLPEGCSIKWTVEGTGVKLTPSADGMTCAVTCTGNGAISVKATVVDENGNAMSDSDGQEASASQSLTAKAGFFQKLISFFKNLFGANRIIAQAFKNIF